MCANLICADIICAYGICAAEVNFLVVVGRVLTECLSGPPNQFVLRKQGLSLPGATLVVVI